MENPFLANCIACHKADGGGGIGPNLTDSYWILGGGIKMRSIQLQKVAAREKA